MADEEESPWIRQEREVMSYNVFYSALTPRATPSLIEHGFELPVCFPSIEDDRLNITAEPDFLLYDGQICFLVEVKSGKNFEPRHIKQLRECDQLTIERMEEFLKDTEVYEKTSYDGDVDRIEIAISYQGIHEAYIANCRSIWDDCREQLESLLDYGAVLAQEQGLLRLVAGELGSPELQSIFEKGIELPANPKQEFVLTENLEAEALAVAICTKWGHRAAQGPVRVTATDIRNEFAPRHAIPFGRIRYVLEFLDDLGACSLVDEDENETEDEQETYEFTVDHMDEILDIEQTVREQSVEEYYRDDDQTGLGDFEDEDE